MHRIRRIGLLTGFAVLASAVLVACGGSDSSPTENGSSESITPVKIAATQWIGYGPFYIADAKGFDKDHGVDITQVGLQTDEAKETGFISGKFPAANQATNNVVRQTDLGQEFDVVLIEDFSLDADAIITCDPSIQSMADVAGKTVAFEQFSVSDILFRYASKEAGVDFDSLDYVPMPASDAGSAVLAGKVDVAVTYEPYLQAALKEDSNCRILFTAGERPGLISDVLTVSRDFASSNPEAVVGVLQAWGDAVDFYKSNPDEAKTIIAKGLGASPKSLEASFKGVKLFSLPESQKFLENDFESLWNEIGDILKDQGQVETVPAISDYLDLEPGKKALGE